VAASIKERFQQEVTLEPGGRGEFTVWVDGRKIAEKSRTGFPAEPAILESLRVALE
jgi:predicted Rdx family selenoprotein